MNEGFDYKYWDEIKIKLFKMYPSLTRSDLLWRHGSKDDLLDMIANKLGKTTKELQNEIDSF
jgi:hypothetical protein